ncbi:hypothetical protein PInf_014560 [Phytophthora infestans]|nr:hypothetical protein PInf_014560 [Phytophthora infestans]
METKRILTAAEQRAARRARVLQGSESRLKLLKGQISSLKTPSDTNESLEQQMDDEVEELVASDAKPAEPPTELKIPPRVDPAQRRRDAAARRRSKEQMVQDILGKETSPSEVEQQDTPTDQKKPQKLPEMCMDLRSIAASLAADDQLFVSYQDLITKGVPMESIRQQFEREQVGPEVRNKLEHLLTQQLKMEAMGETGLAIPVRLLVSTGAKALHKALDLPDVKNPQEGDLGFLANMALSSRPVLKEFLVKARKSLDDVFVFIFALVVSVAIRAIWIS